MKNSIINSLYGTVCAVIVSGALASSAVASDSSGHGLPSSAGHHYPAHIVGMFVGATDGDSTEYTIGLEYEYRASEKFGFGPIVEYTPDAHHGDGVSVYIGGLHFHPVDNLRLTAGVGAEVVHAHGGEAEFLARVGAAYDINVGNGFAFAPTIAVDFVDGEELVVFGITLLKHF